MSASTKRKNRQAEIEAGTYRKQAAQRERDEKQAKEKRTVVICTAAVVVIVLAAILLNLIPDLIERKEIRQFTDGVAVTIGERDYSPAEITYLYSNQFSNMANSYYALFYGLDTSNGAKGLDDQAYGGPEIEGETIETWRDYLLYTVYTQLEQTQVLLNYAKENGITLSEEEKQDVDNDVTSEFQMYAYQYGYSDLDQFLGMVFQKGVTVDMIRGLEQESALAQKAYTAYQESLSFTDEESAAEYAAMADDSDLFSYATFSLEAAVPGEESAESEEGAVTRTPAEADSEIDAVIASYKDGDDVEDLFERFSGYIEEELGETANRSDDVTGSYLPALYADWLKDASRKAGDIEKFVDEDGDHYYAVLFLGRDDNSYATVNVRHILVMAEAGEDGSYSDEALALARAKAESILEEYLTGDKTEESFAALAEQYSEDSGSNTNGGLYENVYKGQMVADFNDFCFAEGRKVGDVAIVYGNNGSYAGYHVVYYAGQGRAYNLVLGENSLIQKALTEFMENDAFRAVPGPEEALVDPVTGTKAETQD